MSQNLQYSKNGGTTWTSISTSTTNDFTLVSSPFVTHGEATSELITTAATGTFRAGSIVSNTTPDMSSTLMLSTKTENEFVIKPTIRLEPLKSYLFRVSPQDLYTSSNYAVLNTNCVVNIITTTSAEICVPGTVTLHATASPGATIKWYSSATGGTELGIGSSFTTPHITTTTTFYAEASLNTCISERVAVNAFVNLFTLETTNDTICHEGILTLSAISTPAAAIEWYADPMMTTLLGTGNTFSTPTLSSSTTYYAISKTPSCSSLVYPVYAHILPRPDISITPEIDTVCTGNYATFTCEDVNTYSYLWSDGTIGATMTTNVPGFHEVEVTNEYGCSTLYTVYLDTFLDISVSGFDFVPLIFESPKTYTFTPIYPVAVTNYLWDFGDGTTSTEMNPTHEYAEFGTYTVSLKVYNDCDSSSTSLTLNVKAENTNITDPTLDKHISLYPNPATSYIQIDNPKGIALKEIWVLNANGQVMHKVSASQIMSNQIIDVSSLPRGIAYMVLINDAHKMTMKKITLL